jgi:acyl dehydratase
VLGVSDWVETKQENVDTFAKLTGDEQAHPRRPRTSGDRPFGTTVQHGFLTLGTAPDCSGRSAWSTGSKCRSTTA